MTRHDEALAAQQASQLALAGEMVGRDVKFERTRRITGYLAPAARWNNAKKAELQDRVKHG